MGYYKKVEKKTNNSVIEYLSFGNLEIFSFYGLDSFSSTKIALWISLFV